MIAKLFKKFIIHRSLFIILVLAALLRFWGLANNPPHLTSDEAAIGYNAYSILKTGRDEHGEFLPLIFKSFGDWKPGLYIYLTVPFVAILGLTELAVRLPGAISGIIAIWLSYLVIGKLFKQSLGKDIYKLQLLGAFFLAVSPWHIHFSRGGWEVGVSLTLTLAGIYCFLRSLDKENQRKFLFFAFSVIFFVLTLWTYQGAKLATGIVVLGLLLFFWKDLIRLPRRFLLKGIFVGIILSLPILLSFSQGKAGRLAVFNVFAYPRSEQAVAEILRQDGFDKSSPLFAIYHSGNTYFAKEVFGRWVNHFSGRFLFFEGDWGSRRHNIPDGGMFLFLDAFLLILGFTVLARFRFSKGTLFVLFWLLLAPLPAALSRDSIHGVRSFNMILPLVILLSLGVNQFLNYFNSRLGKIALLGLAFLYLGNYIYYLDQYWVHSPRRNSQYWYYGYKQIAQRIEQTKSEYEEVIVEQNYAQPYIFFLFSQKYPPEKYQAMANEAYLASNTGDVGLITKLDNISFRAINWSADRLLSNKLFVIDDDGVTVPASDVGNTQQFKYIERIPYLDGTPGFILLGVI